jgi:hypothetical protein
MSDERDPAHESPVPAPATALAGPSLGDRIEMQKADDRAELTRLRLAIAHADNYIPGLVVFSGESFASPGMAKVEDELPAAVRGPFHESLIAACEYIARVFREGIAEYDRADDGDDEMDDPADD